MLEKVIGSVHYEDRKTLRDLRYHCHLLSARDKDFDIILRIVEPGPGVHYRLFAQRSNTGAHTYYYDTHVNGIAQGSDRTAGASGGYPLTLIFENDNTAVPEVGRPIDVAGRKVVKMSMFFTCGSSVLASVGLERMR